MGEVFGRVHLGYIAIETRRFDDWRRFGADAIGLHVDELGADVLRMRMDDRQCRFLLQRGRQEDVTALGWHIDDHESFDAILGRVVAAGVPVAEGTPEECALRGVERLWRFAGPKGIEQEIFTQPVLTDAPLTVRPSAFVTGDGGLGHVAITAKRPTLLRGYYDRLFDARLSDYIDETISGLKLKIRFLRVNERHHSIAVAGLRGLPIDPIRTRIQHLNVQVAELEDMVSSYERVKALGFDIAWGIGQHTNDKELSYYCVTPSGFEWEVGWNPLVVDESIWEPTTHPGISIWGHKPVGETVLDKLNQARLGAASLRRHEEMVPALSGAGTADD